MKVTVREFANEDYTYNSLEIVIDEGTKFHVHSSEDTPEDNNLYRNFSDCYDIPHLLRKAYEAGKRGEEFEIEYVETEDEEL